MHIPKLVFKILRFHIRLLLPLFGFVFSLQTLADSAIPARQLKPKIIGNSPLKGKTISLEDITKFETEFTKYKTTSKYDKEALEFEGLLSDKFLEHFGTNKTSKIKFKAIDGYSVEISKEEWSKFPFLFVVKTNGAFLSPKEKGTFRLMWNFDTKKEISPEVFAPKAIWQITEIEFID
jgi:hypothetical protein